MIKFSKLRKDYENFMEPHVCVLIGGKDLAADKAEFAISDIMVDLTSGYEASVASFVIYNSFNTDTHKFRGNALKKYVDIGLPVEIQMGYGVLLKSVFRGFISSVVYKFKTGDSPGVEIHAMDIKGVMMANAYDKQIAAETYSEAVSKIFSQPLYQKLKGSPGVYDKLNIADTPDKKMPGAPKEPKEHTIEMVNESDYEFVVRAAKRYNYEFFQLGGTVVFRKAKADVATLMALGPEDGMYSFEIGYDSTGMVERVEVRNVDPSKGKPINYALKVEGPANGSPKTKSLLKGQTKVYIDPTAATQKEAEFRANYLKEDIRFRFGSIEAECVGLPELVPGKYIMVNGLGQGPSNEFYITNVIHSMEGDSFFHTKVIGKAEGLASSLLPF